jgi:hypothetical protein
MKVERVQPDVISVKIEMSLEEWMLLRKLLVANVTVPRALHWGGWIEEFEQNAVADIMNSIRIGVEG